MLSNTNERVFFYCTPPLLPEQGAYPHSIVCLAEGLKALGVPFYSNINYWNYQPNQERYLFPHDPAITADDCSIVVLDSDWFMSHHNFPDRFFHKQRQYLTVYFERPASAINLPRNAWQDEFRQFDFIFRTHYNHQFKYPGNVYPWAFGLSNRVLNEIGEPQDFVDKKNTILVNFRLGHPLRQDILEHFLPLLQSLLEVDTTTDQLDAVLAHPYHRLQWEQTGRRHYPTYYQRLNQSAACACFGGLFINPWPPDAFGPTKFWDRVLNKVLLTIDSRPKRLMNWDSFRFWEALAARCVAFHVDLERYGAALPVMPKNWEHYIGVDWENMSLTVDRILADPQQLNSIANQGYKWVVEHYSPQPTALRFLDTVRVGKTPSKLQGL
jgi:hypothetical protein